MNKLSFYGLFLMTLMCVSACGNSPLLHHVNADDIKPMSDPPTQPVQACPLEFHEAKLCASLTWTSQPTSQDEASLTLKFWDSIARNPDGPYVEPVNTPFIQLWMPAMGHGSSPVTMEKLSDGVYKVSKINFIMGGDWDLRVQLKQNRQVIEQVVQSIHIE